VTDSGDVAGGRRWLYLVGLRQGQRRIAGACLTLLLISEQAYLSSEKIEVTKFMLGSSSALL
jgi:hypothetical protein